MFEMISPENISIREITKETKKIENIKITQEKIVLAILFLSAVKAVILITLLPAVITSSPFLSLTLNILAYVAKMLILRN